MLLSKESFVQTINFIKERSEKMTAMNKVFTEEFEDSIFFPYFKYEAQLIKVLKEVFQDKEDWIDYFCYELDFGARYVPGSVSYNNGEVIPMGTSEDLYDFLIKELNEN